MGFSENPKFCLLINKLIKKSKVIGLVKKKKKKLKNYTHGYNICIYIIYIL